MNQLLIGLGIAVLVVGGVYGGMMWFLSTKFQIFKQADYFILDVEGDVVKLVSESEKEPILVTYNAAKGGQSKKKIGRRILKGSRVGNRLVGIASDDEFRTRLFDLDKNREDGLQVAGDNAFALRAWGEEMLVVIGVEPDADGFGRPERRKKRLALFDSELKSAKWESKSLRFHEFLDRGDIAGTRSPLICANLRDDGSALYAVDRARGALSRFGSLMGVFSGARNAKGDRIAVTAGEIESMTIHFLDPQKGESLREISSECRFVDLAYLDSGDLVLVQANAQSASLWMLDEKGLRKVADLPKSPA